MGVQQRRARDPRFLQHAKASTWRGGKHEPSTVGWKRQRSSTYDADAGSDQRDRQTDREGRNASTTQAKLLRTPHKNNGRDTAKHTPQTIVPTNYNTNIASDAAPLSRCHAAAPLPPVSRHAQLRPPQALVRGHPVERPHDALRFGDRVRPRQPRQVGGWRSRRRRELPLLRHAPSSRRGAPAPAATVGASPLTHRFRLGAGGCFHLRGGRARRGGGKMCARVLLPRLHIHKHTNHGREI